jgi:hypothetical protein
VGTPNSKGQAAVTQPVTDWQTSVTGSYVNGVTKDAGPITTDATAIAGDGGTVAKDAQGVLALTSTVGTAVAETLSNTDTAGEGTLDSAGGVVFK